MSRDSPLVSVLVPAFNVAEYVSETLASAISQNVRIDLCVVDDGSSDGTVIELHKFAGSARVFEQENLGVSATRNRLLSLAEAEWLLFLDADDVLPPFAIERALAIVARGDADVVCSDWQVLQQTPRSSWGAGSRVRVQAPPVDDPALAIFNGWWLPPGAVLVRRRFAELVGGFRLDLPVIQDARFLFDLARAGARFAVTGALGLLYRERPGESLSRRDPVAFWRDCLLNTEQVEGCYRSDGNMPGAIRESLLGGFELAARELGPRDGQAAERALRGAVRQVGNGVSPSRWMRFALWARPLLGAQRACRLSARLARGKTA